MLILPVPMYKLLLFSLLTFPRSICSVQHKTILSILLLLGHSYDTFLLLLLLHLRFGATAAFLFPEEYMKGGMATTTATTTVEESPSKVASSSSSSSKKKLKEKSGSGSSLKGSLSSSLFGAGGSNSTGGGVGRMDVSDLPSFPQNDHSLPPMGSELKLGNFVSGLKNHSSAPELNSSAKSSKRKSGSESSNSGASSGGQGSMTNSTHPEGGRRGLSGVARGFSSGSSDGEDEREQSKHGIFLKTRGVKPPRPAGAATTASSVDSDDEATDSADEGNSGGEERAGRRRGREGDIPTSIGAGSLASRQGDRLMSRKDSSESTNSATSPVQSTGHTTSTLLVKSALPKEPMIGPNSPVNMAVGYGAAAESMAPPSAVFNKTPSQSPPGTPTMDSPKLACDGPQSPRTPIPLSSPTTEATEVGHSVTQTQTQ